MSWACFGNTIHIKWLKWWVGDGGLRRDLWLGDYAVKKVFLVWGL